MGNLLDKIGQFVVLGGLIISIAGMVGSIKKELRGEYINNSALGVCEYGIFIGTGIVPVGVGIGVYNDRKRKI